MSCHFWCWGLTLWDGCSPCWIASVFDMQKSSAWMWISAVTQHWPWDKSSVPLSTRVIAKLLGIWCSRSSLFADNTTLRWKWQYSLNSSSSMTLTRLIGVIWCKMYNLFHWLLIFWYYHLICRIVIWFYECLCREVTFWSIWRRFLSQQ